MADNCIVYRTRFNNSMFPDRKEFYYGVHRVTGRSYYGSGVKLKPLLKEFGADAFVVDIIKSGLTLEKAYELEGLIVDKEMLKNPLCLNSRVGGAPSVPHTEEVCERISKAKLGDKNPNWGGKTITARTRELWKNRPKPHRKPVQGIHIETGEVMTLGSARDIDPSLGFNEKSIRDAALGKYCWRSAHGGKNTYKGYVWKYLNGEGGYH